MFVPTMLPRGYKGLVVCDTRRAEEWQEGLRRAGYDVIVAETAPGNDKGSCEVAVVEAQELAAKVFVTEVIQGRAKLPSPPILSATGFKALAAIAALLAVGVAVAVVAARCA